MNTTNDTMTCPFCQQTNYCQANSDKACWCFQAQIPSALIDLLPSQSKLQACICTACISAYNNNEEAFKVKFNLN